MYPSLLFVHTALAAITVAGFLLRGYWLFSGSELIRSRPVRIVPHALDTVFLLTGVALVVNLGLTIGPNSWLLAKFAGLLVYIGLGMVVFRFGRKRQVRLLAFVGALAAFAYVVGAALAKSPASWLAAVAV